MSTSTQVDNDVVHPPKQVYDTCWIDTPFFWNDPYDEQYKAEDNDHVRKQFLSDQKLDEQRDTETSEETGKGQ